MGRASFRERERRSSEPGRKPLPPPTVSWIEHQEALGAVTREYELKLSALRKTSTVEVSVDSEMVAQLEKATAFLSTAASENEALVARVAELEKQLGGSAPDKSKASKKSSRRS